MLNRAPGKVALRHGALDPPELLEGSAASSLGEERESALVVAPQIRPLSSGSRAHEEREKAAARRREAARRWCHQIRPAELPGGRAGTGGERGKAAARHRRHLQISAA